MSTFLAWLATIMDSSSDYLIEAGISPEVIDLLTKLNFILRHDIYPALASRAAILVAIDHYYGPSGH